jgi:hypothetical protein
MAVARIVININNFYATSNTTNNTTDSTTTTPDTNTTTSNDSTTMNNGALVPTAPSNLRLDPLPTASSSYISLKWQDNSTNEGKFIIERKLSSATVFTSLAQKNANITYHNDSSSITPGVRYDYRVKACLDNVGCSYPTYLVDAFIPVRLATDTTTVEKTSDSTTTTTNNTTNTNTTTTNTTTANTSTIVPASSTVNTEITNTTTSETTTLTQEDITEVTKIFSKTVDDSQDTTDTSHDELTKKDTNDDGVSDYDSIYIYKIDPIKPSPVSKYEGRTIRAGEKILLGLDPTSVDIVKITPEPPEESTAPIVDVYKVKDISLTEKKEVVIKGQALPNSFITVYIYSTPIVVVVKTDANGEWEYVLDKELEDGDHLVYTATVNNTGNILAKSNSFSFTKTAEAVSFNDLSNTPTTTNITKPGLLEGINMYVLMAFALASLIIMLVLIGAISINAKKS